MTNKTILTDTGFWIALYDSGDFCHDRAVLEFNRIERWRILFPWPVFYEVLRTKFVKNKLNVIKFEKHLRSLSIEKVDDEPYREAALTNTLDLARKGNRNISLPDMVIRHILQNSKIKIDLMVTNNIQDFADLCSIRRIEVSSLK